MKAAVVSLAAAAFMASAVPALASNIYFSNVGSKGAGSSCSEISGSFPLQATYQTNNGANTYYLNILIQVTVNGTPTQQYLSVVLFPNQTYTVYDPNLFGTFNTISGTWSGPILVSASTLILGNGNGPVELTSGSTCQISLATIAVASPN